ncbi:MAG: NAD(P)H-hydrate dehydratase [Lachnospiraceae bacterium]|nr:NAD(P)H-hydrate dehydratase [Ruminococcus sp.]MCM1275705.1 NAD(P)H-hydrate dehydratase [Lachnospiraceae bacterium]
MRFIVNNAQMKAAEADCNARFISYSEMMFNAGSAVTESIISRHKPCLAAVLCGSGNNGGDGFVIARLLSERGFKVRVVLVSGEPRTDCAREHFGNLHKENVHRLDDEKSACFAFVQNAQIVVDCVFGTGFHGELPEHVAELLAAANRRPVRVAVDVPSGVNSDTGEHDPRCFSATETHVLAALKKGLLNPEALELSGEPIPQDIGVDGRCYKEFEALFCGSHARGVLPERTPSSHKGTFGRLLNIAGSLCYSGAAVMSTRAALRSGAGLCTLAAPLSTVKALSGALVENTFLPLPETPDGFLGENAQNEIDPILPKMSAVAIGCGLGNSENTRKLTEYIVKNAQCPIIIDADGINSLAANINVLKERTGDTVITPHPLELSRISGLTVAEIQRDRIGAAKRFAAEFGVTVLLKGAYTVVSDSSGDETIVNPTGSAALAKGGSGDVLTGVIAAMLAQGIPPYTAASSGAYCHGFAADLLCRKMHPASVLASDVIDILPEVFTSAPLI